MSARPSTWAEAHAALEAALAETRATPVGSPNEDALIEAECQAMDHLVRNVPAPSIREVAVKLRYGLHRFEDFGLPDDYAEAILADMDRLATD